MAERQFGLPPGSLVYLGEKRVENVIISVIDYNEKEFHETVLSDPRACGKYVNKRSVTWINVTGLHDTSVIASLGEVFGFHPLILEDILSTGQRPKLEDLDDYIYCVVQMIYRPSEDKDIISEQVSMILGSCFLITFQETEGDVFDMLRDRIRGGKGRIRKMGCDYLAYSLLDAIVDNYFVILEQIGEQCDELQEQIDIQAEADVLHDVHSLRRHLIHMRRAFWPLREVVGALERSESRLIHENMTPYLRDVYEHTIHAIDSVESLRDTLSGVMDVYMTAVNSRTNDVIKVLTVISTIFMPLTFVTGIYGMNFKHMPELEWRYGYDAVWVVMLIISIVMMIYFRRKKWF